MSKSVSNKKKRIFDSTRTLQKGGREVQKFFTKFNNDWILSSAAGLAYNLILSLVPIVIALIAVVGFIIGGLNLESQHQLTTQIQNVFQSLFHSSALSASVLDPALTSLSRYAGFLALIAIATALFGGSRLFVSIEGYFDIIYRTDPRKFVAQNVMALLMLLLYIILIPLMLFTASLPTLLLTLVHNSALNIIPGVTQLTQNGFVVGAGGVLSSLLISWILFEAIYLVVPNQRISFKKSWLGAVVAAILLQLFLLLFPLYISRFMGSYTGNAGFFVIFLVFFYYFAVILLLGAEINAYFAEGIQPLPDNMATVLRNATQVHKNPEAISPPGRPGQKLK
ncbi:MAG: YihY/virulence factor BrkB family protein [Ktedonobacteraceae bacterium]